MTDHTGLSRRERQIMDVIYQLGQAAAPDVCRQMIDDPGYDSVRVTLGILEKKGHVKHKKDGKRNIYYPTVPQEHATRNAVRNLTKTFFKGSPSRAIVSMLDMSSTRLTEEDLDEIAEWIENERKSK